MIFFLNLGPELWSQPIMDQNSTTMSQNALFLLYIVLVGSSIHSDIKAN